MEVSEGKKPSSFELLAAVNVNAKIEKKNGLSYLSWAWAWDQLMRLDPEAEYEYGDPKQFGETLMVFCTVKAFGRTRTAHLPVMDYKNRAIANPTSFEVNTAMQRCLVKAIALHGLGLYIYAGEDLPESEGNKEEEPKKNGKLRPARNELGKKPYFMGDGVTIEPERLEELEFTIKRTLDWCEQKRWADALLEMDNCADGAEEKLFMWSFLDSAQRSAITKEVEAQKKKYLEENAGSQA
jgi:hypothetical protein